MDTSQVSYQQQQFSKYSEEYELINDVWELLAKTEDLKRYLPARYEESDESYLLRLQTTKLPRTYRDSVERAGGRLGNATVSDDALNPIKGLEANADGMGKTLDTLVFETFVYILKNECVAALIDVVNGQAAIQLIPVTAIRNISLAEDGSVARLVVESEEYEADEYALKKIKRYKEYLPGELKIWKKQDDGDVTQVDAQPLINADNQARDSVYAVWFGCIGSKAWTPGAPPLLDLAKDCILQMHKVSELDRAETITALPPILRELPPGADPKAKQENIVWDPGSVINIPSGGNIRPADSPASQLTPMHQRNLDRQAQMENAVDAYLSEQVRTDYQAFMADNAETSRLELLVKILQQGFKDCFRFAMQLSDRRYNPADDPGSLVLSATAYDQVTDDEIRLLNESYSAGTLPLGVAQQISIQQWKARGYDVDETPATPALAPQIIEE